MKTLFWSSLFLLVQLVVSAHSFVSLTTSRGGGSLSRSPQESFVRMAASAKPFADVVQAEIVPDRMDEFLEMIKKNA